jgi:putative nucleotidyltransferase with HDIG domain
MKFVRVDNEVVSEGDFTNEAGQKGFIIAMKDRVYVSPVFVWKAANHVEIALPLKGTPGTVVKVLKVKVNVEKVWGGVSVGLPGDFISYLVDNHGNLVAYPERSIMHKTRNVGHLHIIQDFLSGLPSHFEREQAYETVTGAKVVGVYVPIKELGWAVVVERPAMDVYRPLYIILGIAVGVTLLCLAGFLSWSVLSARAIGTSMKGILEGATRIGSGETGYRLKLKTRDEYGQLAEGLNRMADLLEERSKELLQTNEEMKALLYTFTTLVQEVSHSTSLDEVLTATLRMAAKMTGAAGGEVFLLDEELQEMVPLLSEGLDKEFFLAAKAFHFKRGAGLPGMVYERGEPVYLEDLAECPCPYRKEVAREKGYLSALYVPLKAREKVHGCLGVISRERRQYSQNTVNILELMGTIAASFIESARNYGALEDKTQELSKKVEALKVMTEIDRGILLKIGNLNELFEGVTHLIGRLMPCDRVTIVMVDKGRGGFVYHYGWGIKVRTKGDFVPFEQTNATQVVKEKRPILRNNIREVRELLPLDRQFLEEGFLSDLRVPILLEDEVIGLLNIGSKRVAGFRTEDVSTAEGIASQISLAFAQARLVQGLKDSLLDTVKCLSEAVDAKSPWTRGHSERVAELSCDIAKELGLGVEEIEKIRMAALLHDVGKIGTFEELLDKPGKLTPEEWEIVKGHCAKGVQIISPVERFKELIPMILHHHERYDGKGYPEGKKGEEIPLGARILCVADAVDAMMSERPYREAMPIEKVLQELRNNAGIQFCPKVVEAALKVL